VTVAGLDGETVTQRHVLRHVAVSPARLKLEMSLGSWLRKSVRKTGARHRGLKTPGQPHPPISRKLRGCYVQNVGRNKKTAHTVRGCWLALSNKAFFYPFILIIARILFVSSILGSSNAGTPHKHWRNKFLGYVPETPSVYALAMPPPAPSRSRPSLPPHNLTSGSSSFF
jgi:hypothetical protein